MHPRRVLEAAPAFVGRENQVVTGVEHGLSQGGMDRLVDGPAKAGPGHDCKDDCRQQAHLRPEQAQQHHKQADRRQPHKVNGQLRRPIRQKTVLKIDAEVREEPWPTDTRVDAVSAGSMQH